MKTITYEENVLILYTNHGHELMYQDGEAVAGFIPMLGYFKLDTANSSAVKRYLEGHSNAIRYNKDDIERIYLTRTSIKRVPIYNKNTMLTGEE